MDSLYFEELWDKQKKPNLNVCENFWDNRAEEFNEGTDGDGERVDKIIRILKDKGVLGKDKSVLDIGCGAGKFAFKFAPLVQELTGIDLSGRMLDFAQANAQQKGLTNIGFEKIDWGELNLKDRGWDKGFDLVFAANCPGINSKSALEKMIAASRGYCFISTFVAREDSIKDELGNLLHPGSGHGRRQGTSFYCIFNILWHLGYHPEITYADGCWEHVMSKEKAYQYYETHFSMFQTLDQNQKDLLNKYLEQISGEDGFIKDQVQAKFGWIYWQV